MSIALVLGSGGHSSELVQIISNLPKSLADPAKHSLFLSSDDKLSLLKYKKAFGSLPEKIYSIPRARHVGQSYLTSIFTTIYTIIFTTMIFTRFHPKMVTLFIQYTIHLTFFVDYMQWPGYFFHHFIFSSTCSRNIMLG